MNDVAGRTLLNPDLGELLERKLEAVRIELSRELSAIPMPVPGCDVNFNRLLEDRSLIVDDLQRLNRLRRENAVPAAYLEFAGRCVWLDAATRELIAAAASDNGAPQR